MRTIKITVKCAGFTFIEFLMALGVLGILLTITVVAMRDLMLKNQITAEVNQIIAAVNFARSEAIKRGIPVTYCASDNGKACHGDWSDGQIILAASQVLRIYPALFDGSRLNWSGNFGKDHLLQLLPTGFTNGQSGSFYYCPAIDSMGKRIIVNQAGRTRVAAENIACPLQDRSK